VTIENGVGSKFSPISESQVSWMVATIHALERIFQSSFKAIDELSVNDYRRFSESDEYGNFIDACLNTGFVCDDYASGLNLELIHNQPEEIVPHLTLAGLRHYVHSLQRADKWSDVSGAIVLEALRSQALGAVAQRLQSVQQNGYTN
jgi:hypothetical protein